MDLKHGTDDALEREVDQHDREKENRELDDLADEAEIAAVAAKQVEDGGDADCGERQEQQGANEDQDASAARALTTAHIVPASRPDAHAGHHAGESCQPWNAEGTSAGSAKVTSSNASVRARSARATALLSPWPDLNAVYCPISGYPSR